MPAAFPPTSASRPRATIAPRSSRRGFLLGLGAASLLAGGAPAATVGITSRKALDRALAAAQGGETLVLADGAYGGLKIAGRSFRPAVTLTSATPRGARFDAVEITGSEGLILDQLHVASPDQGTFSSAVVSIQASSGITLRDSEVNGPVDGDFSGHHGLHTDLGSRDITFARNYVHDVKNGATFIDTSALTVTGNVIDRIGNDSFKLIAITGGVIDGNTGARNVFPQPGSHLDFVQFQGADSRDIVLRGNVFLPGARTDVQGIFLDDARFTHVMIERNIIVTSMIRGISVSGARNTVARYNTVLDVPGAGKATYVMLDGEVYGNIMSTYPGDKKLGIYEGNLLLQHADPRGRWHYDTVFRNARAGSGITLADLAPVPGGLAESYGAMARTR
ncbi:MAG: right-handed parallel beta-helix repeat-containing protein [Pseudooceanicola nanhaiensis]